MYEKHRRKSNRCNRNKNGLGCLVSSLAAIPSSTPSPFQTLPLSFLVGVWYAAELNGAVDRYCCPIVFVCLFICLFLCAFFRSFRLSDTSLNGLPDLETGLINSPINFAPASLTFYWKSRFFLSIFSPTFFATRCSHLFLPAIS